MGDDRFNLYSLPDIRSVQVDKNIPYEERVLEFVRQLKGDPYHFRCGKYSITTSFNQNGLSLEDGLRKMISW
jgi:hypothetical protein